ncbi:PilN domain-containing protein [Thermomonas sp.]|uniref:PilN domain-containing protein n=1 Tax=Thermomonas sp. TaxID=1971895 RepID=UPI00260C2307|nr:PilN domain-containing protein [Thermomonas sp.]MCO5054836.1 PilN domain-containing protein [Thermomonas sp.]
MTAAASFTASGARLGTGLRGFFGWWGAGLAQWLPTRVRAVLAARGDRLLLVPRGDELLLQRWHEGQVKELTALPLPLPADRDALDGVLREPLAELPRWLLLPAAQGLRRPLTLPAATRERLRAVLGFEIERQTPFAADAVLFDGRLLGERPDGSLQAELVVVPRQRFDAVGARLGGLGARLAGIDLADAEGRALGVNLLAPAQRFRRADPWRWLNLGLGVVALLALLLGLHQLLNNRRAAAAELKATIAQRQTQAQGISAARQRVVDSVEGETFLRALRNDKPASVEVMEALSQRIPDGTYLEKLAIEGNQLTLVGLSNQAAALVGQLEGAPQWTSAALSGALQADPRSRLDRFTMIAQLAKTNAAAAPAPAAAPTGGTASDAR